MLIQIDRKNNILIARPLITRFTQADVYDFKAKLGRYIEQGENRIILDLSKITFMDSNGLGAIVSINKMLELASQKKSGGLIITGLNESVLEMFELTKMDRVFKIFSDLNDAFLFWN